MRFRKAITLLAVYFIWIKVQGQEVTISGTVVDKATQSVIEFANVELLNLPDSTITKATVTDRKGKFSIQTETPGNFLLRCTFIGYQKTNLPVSIKSSVSKFNVGTIEIVIFSGTLSEVTVTSRKSLLNTSIDRKVYNVSQDIIAQTGSASDVLKNIPSIEVDIEGEVSLRGSADVMILINGRPSPLMGKTRAEVLQQLPANSIERIEVITNPSARFRPDGTSGIINIVLKKNTKAGWNGNLTANAGTRERYNASINLNYNPGKFNLFGSYGIRKDNRIRTNDIDRIYLDSNLNKSEYYIENNQSLFDPLSHIVALGIDYTLNEQNSFGVSGNYVNREMVRNNVANSFYYDKNYLLTLHYDRLMYDPEFEIEKDASVYWQHNFPQEDHELRFEFTTSASKEQDDNRFTNVYHYPSMITSYDNTLLSEGEHQQQLTIDYSNPLAEDKKLEIGYSGSFTKLDLNFYGEHFDPVQDIFVMDIIKSNRFLYNDAIHAIYGTFQQSFEKFGYSAGLRAEQVFIRGNLVTKDSLIDNSYFKIYPTLHLSYKLKKSEIQLNYSRRVNRPDGDELNPFPEYRDPRNLSAGNPKLLPEIIHSVEFGYKWENQKFSFVPSLYYRYKLNGFTSVTIPINDSTLLTTEENLSNDKSTGLELIFSAKAGNFFRSNLSSNFFYNKIDATDLGFSNQRSIVSMSSNFNSTFIITKTTMLQISSNYRSARLTPQGKVFGSFVMNAGARQDLFKKKLSIILTASDIFNTMQQKSELNTPFLTQTTIGKRDARILYLGLSYNFGKTIKKTDEDKLQFDNSID